MFGPTKVGFWQLESTYVTNDYSSILFLLLQRILWIQSTERWELHPGDMAFPGIRWTVVDGHEGFLIQAANGFGAVAKKIVVVGVAVIGREEVAGLSIYTSAHIVRDPEQSPKIVVKHDQW